MSRSTSILLVIGFLIGGAIFGFVFWHVQIGAGDELQKSLEKNNVSSDAVSPVAETNATTPNANAEGQKQQTQTAPAPETTPETTAEKPKDETADWETFRDEKNNFEFKHPADLAVVSSGEVITISKDAVSWKVRIYANKKNLDLSSWYTAYFSEKERRNCVLTDSSVKVGSYETKYANPNVDPTKCERDGYFATGSDKKIVLKINLDKETVENANKILATLKFDT